MPNLPNLSLTPEVRGFNNPQLSIPGEQREHRLQSSLRLGTSASTCSRFSTFAASTFCRPNADHTGPGRLRLQQRHRCLLQRRLTGAGTPSVCANPDQYMYWDFERIKRRAARTTGTTGPGRRAGTRQLEPCPGRAGAAGRPRPTPDTRLKTSRRMATGLLLTGQARFRGTRPSA